MKLLLPNHIETLRRNAFWSDSVDDFDPWPVVKLFTPDAGCTWLLTSLEPDEPDIAWGLCDLGLGCAEFGTVSLRELGALRGRLGLPVERDIHFEARGPISAYIAASYPAGRIIEDIPDARQTEGDETQRKLAPCS